MAAQPGGSILLQYGAARPQQSGASVVLSYGQEGGATTVRVRSGVVGSWSKASPKVVELFAPHPVAMREDKGRDAPWGTSERIEASDDVQWNATAANDDQRRGAWGEFGDPITDESGAKWKAAVPSDDQRTGAWSVFGDPLTEERGSRWKGSKAVDQMRDAIWGGFLVPIYIATPYDPPAAAASDFVVVGGGIIRAQISGAIADTGNPVSAQIGAAFYVPPYLGNFDLSWEPPEPKRANFTVGKGIVIEQAVDEYGNPKFRPMATDTVRLNPWGAGKSLDRDRVHPWLKYSRPLNPGWGIVVPGGPIGPEPGQQIIIPVQRAYIVVNEILLARSDDNTPISAMQLSVSFDCDSWLPTFSATVPESARDAVMPDPSPVEVYAYLNGSEFSFLVEKVSRGRQFGQATVTISGRGLACELDAPYATESQRTNSADATAQQLISSALEFTIYTQTWNITDWLVPAGVFSLYGTPAAVAASVAEASGSVLAADWALRDLRMLPRYPVKPWEWDTAEPDIIIPAAITQNESVEWVERPAYNLVFVSGVQSGVLGQVKITGTAGDTPAPMVTHPLITHADAARQRGISILGNTGRKTQMQISLPVLESTGVIDICKLVEFSDGANTRRGIVRANNVSVNWPTVRQTLTIEAAA